MEGFSGVTGEGLRVMKGGLDPSLKPNPFLLASFPGPAQLPIACSMQAMGSWAGHASDGKLGGAQVMGSWAGPGNEATFLLGAETSLTSN